jgi:glyoxylate/hydroxypyruvate reductase A
MTLLVRSGGAAAFAEWQAAFTEFAPDLEVRIWTDPEVVESDVRYVMVWDPEPGRIAQFPNLRLICSAAAGVDHILRDPLLPTQLPLVRLITADQSQRMAEYVAWGVLSLMRRLQEILINNAARGFDSALTGETASETRVGVMGLGAMGARSAEVLVALGFQVAGWSNSPKRIEGVESFAGPEAFGAFLARSDILVCLLPLTPSTTGVICAETIAQLPPGAFLVNAGRGGHVVTQDLIEALDTGRLGGAILDVFDPEPLPKESALWSHPKVLLTPHVASFGSRRVRARHVAELIAAFERGEALPGLYDPVKGY